MNCAIKHLETTHAAICNSIERKHEQIAETKIRLTELNLSLLDLMQEEESVFKAIKLLSDDELPTRLEGSE